MRITIFLAMFFLAAMSSKAVSEDGRTAVSGIEKIDAPRDAIAVAFRDATSTPAEFLPLLHAVRYVWVNKKDEKKLAAHVLSVNHALGHSSSLVRPVVLELKHSYVVKWNFIELADSKETLKLLLDTWELMANEEAYFSQLVRHGKFKLVPCEPWKYRGRTYRSRWVEVPNPSRSFGLHACGDGIANSLAKLTNSEIPIVRHDTFLVRAGSTIDHGYGDGLYYKYRGIEGLNLARMIADSGADVEASRRFNSDRASVLEQSRVTNNPRRVRFYPSLKAAVDKSYGFGVVYTEDTADESVDDSNDVFRNLSVSKYDASRLFAAQANGLQTTWLGGGNVDAEGNLIADENEVGEQQASAPDNIVHNFYSGSGSAGTRRLHGGFVCCGQCHVEESGSWFQPVPNDLMAILSEEGGLDIFGDRTKVDNIEVIQSLVAQYNWKPDDIVLQNARDQYDTAVVSLVGQYFDESENPTRDVWRVISSQFNSYVHGLVYTKQALFELGYNVDDEKEAQKLFRAMYPSAFIAGRYDPTVALLRAGKGIKRWKWERVYADLAICDPGFRLSDAGRLQQVLAGWGVQQKAIAGSPSSFFRPPTKNIFDLLPSKRSSMGTYKPPVRHLPSKVKSTPQARIVNDQKPEKPRRLADLPPPMLRHPSEVRIGVVHQKPEGTVERNAHATLEMVAPAGTVIYFRRATQRTWTRMGHVRAGAASGGGYALQTEFSGRIPVNAGIICKIFYCWPVNNQWEQRTKTVTAFGGTHNIFHLDW